MYICIHPNLLPPEKRKFSTRPEYHLLYYYFTQQQQLFDSRQVQETTDASNVQPSCSLSSIPFDPPFPSRSQSHQLTTFFPPKTFNLPLALVSLAQPPILIMLLGGTIISHSRSPPITPKQQHIRRMNLAILTTCLRSNHHRGVRIKSKTCHRPLSLANS